jgi:plasmid stabilization system protein ParE
MPAIIRYTFRLYATRRVCRWMSAFTWPEGCNNFAPSERVEIARRIEEALAGRVGNPQLGKHLPNKPYGKSTDIAANSVGWSGVAESIP